MLHNLSGKHRVLILSLAGIVFTLFVGGTATYSMLKIGKVLEVIAEEVIPLTNALANITTHQLEQGIYFERSIRFAEFMHERPHAKEQYLKFKEKFLQLATQVDQEILDAEQHIAHILKIETDNPRVYDFFLSSEQRLKEIESTIRMLKDFLQEKKLMPDQEMKKN